MTRSARRGPWLPEEDQALLQLVRTQGANNWVRISQQLEHRSPKQCRERYHQNLKPSLKHDPISTQEGEVIERLVQEMGKRWAEIARRLGNRSDNAVKNWWNGSVNRRRRNPGHMTTSFRQVGSRLQPIPFTLPPGFSQSPRQPSLYERNNGVNLSPVDIQQHPPRPNMLATSQIPNPIHIRSQPGTANSPQTSLDPTHLSPVQSTPYSGSIDSRTRPSLSRVTTTEMGPELAPLRSASFHLQPGEGLHPTTERGPISPALSETSQRPAPSLISDNHSLYSISPQTVSTPRPGLPAPMELMNSTWSCAHSSTLHNPRSTTYNPPSQSDSYSQDTDRTPFTSGYRRPSLSLSHTTQSKDTRMNVSTLLQ